MSNATNRREPAIRRTAETSRVEVVAHETRARGRFTWTWISPDGSARSERAFAYFYDCVQDARRAGHAVDLRAPDSNVPGDPAAGARPDA